MDRSARQFLATGAALTCAAIMTTTAPATVLSQPSQLRAGSPAYQLTAAADISGQGLGVVLLVGWGDFIGPEDPYFPGQFTNDLRINGPIGVAYYVIDSSMDSAVTKDLENYVFELAARESDPVRAIAAAARAAAYVAVASNLGVGSVPAKLAKSLIYGVPFDLPGAIVQLAAPIPLVGDITSVYFTGRAEGDPALYGTGLNGLVAYSGTLLPWLKPLLGPAGRPLQAAAVEPVEADVQAGPEVLTAELAAVPSDGPSEVHVAIEIPEPVAAEPVAVEIPEPVAVEIPEPVSADTPEPVAAETPRTAPADTPEPVVAEIPAEIPAEPPVSEPALEESLAPTAERAAQPEAPETDATTDAKTAAKTAAEPAAQTDDDKPAQRSGDRGRRGQART
jgi:hypothetical protein